ncbi:hypothetical protein F0L68_05295 [Solihabitans fulvus]|uniref:Uncharacterized protein n=2 Tax=Solihabitans fulvus TaxID=1892852 RepID=A0A5B2XQW9_9PSEU|nr:hypothetical protein F0L68_05295 [Solihabitans fulvus]
MCLTLCWGVLTSTGWVQRTTGRQALRSGHLVLATLALAFGALHALSFGFLDDERFDLLRLTVPLLPGGLVRHALGIVGIELMLAIAISTAVQRLLVYRRWLWLHRLAYPAVGLTVLHSLFGAIANGHLAVLWLGGITLFVPTALLAALRFVPTGVLTRSGLVEEER